MRIAEHCSLLGAEKVVSFGRGVGDGVGHGGGYSKWQLQHRQSWP